MPLQFVAFFIYIKLNLTDSLKIFAMLWEWCEGKKMKSDGQKNKVKSLRVITLKRFNE